MLSSDIKEEEYIATEKTALGNKYCGFLSSHRLENLLNSVLQKRMLILCIILCSNLCGLFVFLWVLSFNFSFLNQKQGKMSLHAFFLVKQNAWKQYASSSYKKYSVWVSQPWAVLASANYFRQETASSFL